MLNFFKNNTVESVIASVKREKYLNETDRMQYNAELLDTYEGFGLKYLYEFVDKTFQSEITKNSLKNVLTSYPILYKIIRDLSKVYKQQPLRSFYLEGKKIIESIPNGIEDPENIKNYFIIDKELYNVLNNSLYSTENKMTIKDSEKKANLLNTCIYKVITEKNKIMLRFLSSDAVTIEQDFFDVSRCNRIFFRLENNVNTLGTVLNMTFEEWTQEYFKRYSVNGKKNDLQYEGVNNAQLEYQKLFNEDFNGWAFAPFIVIRNALPSGDFWNVLNVDLLHTIKLINIGLSELRYLVRYASFGMKYMVNLEMPSNGINDVNAILSLKSNSDSLGNSQSFQVGSIDASGKMQEVTTAIQALFKILYDAFGIPLDSMMFSNQSRSAESKTLDLSMLKDFIEDRKDIFRLNEENIFKCMCAVWNRDMNYKIPKNISLKIDFYDDQEDDKVKIENWLAYIDANIKSYVDWMREANPDLSESDAMALLSRNKEINSMEGYKEDSMEDKMQNDTKENDQEIKLEAIDNEI